MTHLQVAANWAGGGGTGAGKCPGTLAAAAAAPSCSRKVSNRQAAFFRLRSKYQVSARAFFIILNRSFYKIVTALESLLHTCDVLQSKGG